MKITTGIKRWWLIVPGSLLLSALSWGQGWGPRASVQVAFGAPAGYVQVERRWDDGRWNDRDRDDRRWENRRWDRDREWRERESRQHEWRERERREQWRRWHRREEYREYRPYYRGY
jgi:hypothetical protein